MKPDLEFVLNRIPWTQNFKQLITATTKTERTKVQTPVYAAPGRIIDNSFQIGIYTPNEELIYVPIGLSQTTDFNTAYYRYGHSGNWIEEDEKRDVTYLPVRKTNLFIDLAREDKYLKGSPFQVYSLHGLEYPFPFMIFDLHNEDQIKVQGFYKSSSDMGAFVHSIIKPEEEKWREHFLRLESSVYSFKSFKKGANEIDIETEPIPKPEASLASTQQSSVGNASNINGEPEKTAIDWNEPSAIKAYLDRFVIGQHQAKKTLAIAFSNYMAEMETKQSLPREHVMLVGPTGSGKTMMISLLAKAANLPKAITKFSLNTKEGYVGQSLSDSCLQIQAQTSEENPYGLIVIDEIDKAAPGIHFHNWGNELQDEIISLVEETSMKLTTNKGGHRDDRWFNTKNLLFIAAGAFHGGEGMSSIYDLIAHRLGGGGDRKKIGFQTEGSVIDKEPSKLLEYLIPDDLVKFGLKPELVGRFSARAILRQLTVDDKVRILNESENSPIHYYRRLFDVKGYELVINEDAKRIIVEACPTETGARALNQICTELFSEIIYQPKAFANLGVIVVDKDLAKELISKIKKPEIEVPTE